MRSIVLNIKNEQLADQLLGLFEHLKGEGLEVISKEDFDDLKLLKATRAEESVPFESYLKNEH